MCVYVCAQLCLTLCNPWTIACQAPLFMEFSRQEYQSGLPFPPPGDLPNPGIEPRPFASPALAGWFFTTGAIWEFLFSLLSSLNANLPLLSLMFPHFLIYGEVKTFP